MPVALTAIWSSPTSGSSIRRRSWHLVSQGVYRHCGPDSTRPSAPKLTSHGPTIPTCVTRRTWGIGQGTTRFTNRRSRGPCKTDALTREAFEATGRCIGVGSSVAEGDIVMEYTCWGVGCKWDVLGRGPRDWSRPWRYSVSPWGQGARRVWLGLWPWLATQPRVYNCRLVYQDKRLEKVEGMEGKKRQWLWGRREEGKRG